MEETLAPVPVGCGPEIARDELLSEDMQLFFFSLTFVYSVKDSGSQVKSVLCFMFYGCE